MKIELITKPSCSACSWLKTWLTTNNYDFKETIIGEHVSREAVVAEYPDAKVVPIVLLDDIWIGTKEDLIRRLSIEKKETLPND